MNWFFTLGSAIQNALDAKEHDIDHQRKTFDIYIRKHWSHRPQDEWPKLQLKQKINENELEVRQFEERGLKDQSAY